MTPQTGDAGRPTATLLISCPDQMGIVATVSDFIYKNNANILESEQHQDLDLNLFLMRIEWALADFKFEMSDFAQRFAPIAERFQMSWRVALSNQRPKVAILVSRLDHCLQDLLYRQRAGELRCEFPLVISNHADARRWADFYNVPYHVIPVEKDSKRSAEKMTLELLSEHNIDLIVLARYMQILSPEFIARFPSRIINIHHSFLPAFIGAKPYHRSYERGVKLVGATAHYVTEVLDEGPIIEQGVIRITHRDTLEALIEKGRDLEKVVLSRAVRWHVENRVVLYGNKVAVFD
jgi:formyltetrahydrofolate deformylase